MKTIISAFALIFCASFSKAQWVQNTSIEGGAVNHLFTSDGALYAGTTGGIFKFADNGASWSYLSTAMGQIPGDLYTSKTIAKGNTILAITNGSTQSPILTRSTNAGSTWATFNFPATYYVLDIDTFKNNFYAIIIEFTPDFSNGVTSLFKSTDDGATFTKASTVEKKPIGLFMKSFNSTLYFVSDSLKSTTDGSTVTNMSTTGLPPASLFADLCNIGTDLFIISRNSTTYVADVYKFNGITWSKSSTGLPGVYAFYLTAVNNTLYIGTNDPVTGSGQQVYKSTNSGTSWTKTTGAGLLSPIYNSLASAGSNKIIGGFDSGVFESSDQGESWTPKNTNMHNGVFSTLQKLGDHLFINDDYRGVFKSADAGKTFVPYNFGLPQKTYYFVNMRGNQDALFLNLLYNGGKTYGIYSLINFGTAWLPLELPDGADTTYLELLGAAGHTVFIRSGGQDVFASSDKGKTWDDITNTFPAQAINAIEISGYDSVMYLTSRLDYNGQLPTYIARSTDGGITWKADTKGLPANMQNTSVFVAEGSFYVHNTASNGTLLYKRGATQWNPVNAEGLGKYFTISSMGAHDNVVYALGSNGVSSSTDDAATFVSFNNGLWGGLDISSISFVNDTAVIATKGNNLFRNTAVKGVVGINNNIAAAAYLSISNYPNPACKSTSINFKLAESGSVKIELFNVKGELVKELLSENKTPGSYTLPVNTEAFPSGAYLYKITTPTATKTNQMIIVN